MFEPTPISSRRSLNPLFPKEPPQSPEGYVYVRAWGKVRGLSDSVIKDLQEEAWSLGLPLGATIRVYRRGGPKELYAYWFLYRELPKEYRRKIQRYLPMEYREIQM